MLIAPAVTIGIGDGSPIGYVSIIFATPAGTPGIFFPGEDRIGILPGPGGSFADPCGDLGIRVLRVASGAFYGVQLVRRDIHG